MPTSAPIWPEGTRRKLLPLGLKSKVAGAQTLIWDLPRTGILSKLILSISVTIAGAPATLNALGVVSAINRVRLQANNGIMLADLGPASIGWLLPSQQEMRNQSTPTAWNGRTVVAAGTFDLSFVIPVALNSRDPYGLVNLQNPDTAVQLQIEFAADSVVAATGITSIVGSVYPYVEVFTMPLDPKARPDFRFLHVLQEESQVVSGAGDINYQLPRGNVYVSLYQGLGIAAAGGSDSFTQAIFRVNGGDVIESHIPGSLSTLFSFYRSGGQTRNLGLIPWDWSASSGLGDYGSSRDFYDSMDVTDSAVVITASAAGTLYTLRRMLVPLAV